MSGGITATLVALGVSAATAAMVANVIIAVVIIATIAFTAYMLATMKMPNMGGSSLARELKSRSQIVRSSVEPRRYIYGEIMTSGALIYSLSVGSTNEFLYMVVALAGHQCEAIGDCYIGDKISTDPIFYATTPGTPEQGHTETVTDEYGNVISSTYVVDVPATPSVTRSLITVTKHLGSVDQLADAELVAQSGGQWTNNHRLQGVTYAVVKLEYIAAAFPNGIPNIKFIVKGNNQIYDPRTATYGYSNNWALCVRDFLSKPYGIACLPDELNDANDIYAANICDEDVEVQTGTGVNYTTNGQAYETDRTLIYLVNGSGTILAGDHITITVAGGTYNGIDYPASNYTYTTATGLVDGFVTLATGLLSPIPPVACPVVVVTVRTEKRYTCNGSFTADNKPVDIMKSLLTAAVGTVVWSQGQYFINPAHYRTPEAYVITESDLRGSLGVQPAKSSRDKFNTVRGTFADPANYWQQVDFPPVKNSIAIADDGQELAKDIQLNYTTSSSAAQRIGKIFLEQELQSIVVNFPGKLSLFGFKAQDVVKLSIASMGWVEKEFRIINWEMGDTAGIDLALREESAQSYEWNSGMETVIDPAPNTILPNPWFVTPPSDLVITDELTGVTGKILTQLVVDLTPAADVFVSSYEVQAKRQDSNDWQFIGNDLHSIMLGVDDGYIYNVRARSFNQLGIPSDYITKDRLVLGLKTPPPDVTGFTINSIGTEAYLAWTPVSDIGLSHYTLHFSPLTIGATWSSSTALVPQISGNSVTVPAMVGTYLLKAVRIGGSESVNSIQVVSNIASIQGLNAIEVVQGQPNWTGSKVNTEVFDGVLRLKSVETLSDWIRLSAVTSLSYGITGYNPTGTFESDIITDLGAVYTSRLTAQLKALAINTQNVMNSWNPLSSIINLSGSNLSQWGVKLEVATTNDDPILDSWSVWKEFVVGDYSARAFKFKLTLTSSLSYLLVEVTEMTINIDMPDRIYSLKDITCPASGLRVDFSPHFRALKALAVDSQDMQTGDYKTITNKDEQGFDIQYFNSSNVGIQRTFDFVATGYGVKEV